MYKWLRTCVFSAILFAVSTIDVSGQKDTLFVKNHPSIAGELKKIKDGELIFDGNELGKLKIDLEDVEIVSTQESKFRVMTFERDFLIGKLKKSEKEGIVKIESKTHDLDFFGNNISEEIELPFTAIYIAKEVKSEFWDKFSGDFDFGYSFTRNSGVGRWNGGIELLFQTKTLDIILDGNIILTQSAFLLEENTLERERENIRLMVDRYLDARVYAFGISQYQRNLELNILRRFQNGLGIGYIITKNKKLAGAVESGLIVNQELTTDQVQFNNLFEVPLSLKLDFFKINNPDIRFEAEQTFFTSLSQSGRFRNDGDIKVKWEMFDDFNLKLSFYNNFDTVSPITRGFSFDYGIILGFGYSF